MSIITDVNAREILIPGQSHSEVKYIGRRKSGGRRFLRASTGAYEARGIKDGDQERFGQGVLDPWPLCTQ